MDRDLYDPRFAVCMEASLIKRIGRAAPQFIGEGWRDLGGDVDVDLTSEDPECPVERALLADGTTGWRASAPGAQTISLSWREPIPIQRIRLVFEEHSRARTQEFVLRALTGRGPHEIVRQQFTFSPPGTTVEREEYTANLDAVSRLDLIIVPAIDGGTAVATLREWRIA